MNLIPPNDSRFWDILPVILVTISFWAACYSPWVYASKPTAGDIANWLGIIGAIIAALTAKGFLSPTCKT